jgi:hypothetical protein
MTMQYYRGTEYTVVQCIERGVWKWSTSVADMLVTGKAGTRSEAVAAAEKAIDRALSLKKRRTKALGGPGSAAETDGKQTE